MYCLARPWSLTVLYRPRRPVTRDRCQLETRQLAFLAYHHFHRLFPIFGKDDLCPILVDTWAVDPSSDLVNFGGGEVVLFV